MYHGSPQGFCGDQGVASVVGLLGELADDSQYRNPLLLRSCSSLGSPALVPSVIDFLAIAAGFAQCAVRHEHFVVAARARSFEHLQRPVEFALADGVRPAVFGE